MQNKFFTWLASAVGLTVGYFLVYSCTHSEIAHSETSKETLYLMTRNANGLVADCIKFHDTPENTKRALEKKLNAGTCVLFKRPQYYLIDCGPVQKAYVSKTLEFCQMAITTNGANL